MKKIMMIFLMLFVMVSMVSAFEIYPSNIEMVKGKTLINDAESGLTISYAKSKEKIELSTANYYVVFIGGFSIGEQFIISLRDSNFIFPNFLPSNNEGYSYTPRRRMVFYQKSIEEVNFEMDTITEDVYFDDAGLIYVNSFELGKCVLVPIASKNYPFIDR